VFETTPRWSGERDGIRRRGRGKGPKKFMSLKRGRTAVVLCKGGGHRKGGKKLRRTIKNSKKVKTLSKRALKQKGKRGKLASERKGGTNRKKATFGLLGGEREEPCSERKTKQAESPASREKKKNGERLHPKEKETEVRRKKRNPTLREGRGLLLQRKKIKGVD